MPKTESDHESSRPRSRRLRVVGALIALALLAAACGSSSDPVGTADSGTADSGTADSGDTGSTDDNASTSGDTGSTDDNASTSGDTGSTDDNASTSGDSGSSSDSASTGDSGSTDDTPTETLPADSSDTTSTTPTSSTTSTMPASSTTSTTSTTTAPAGPPIAPFDNDSANNPAQSVFMSITGNRSLTHTDEISWSGGDNEDFVEFELPNGSNPTQRLESVSLTCTLDGTVGNAVLGAEVLQDGSRVSQGLVLCGDAPTKPTVDNTKPALVRIYFQITNEGVHGNYTLTVQAF
jgi:hypothetical protein